VTCSSSASASTDAELASALASAAPGSCVLAKGTFAASVTVPAGVALASPGDARATFTGGADAKTPAITLSEGATLADVDVIDAPGVGVAVRAGAAKVTGVHVSGAKNAALAIRCDGPACANGEVDLNDVTLTSSSLGLWASGAHVVWAGGRSAEHASTSLAAAFGVVVQDGARLDASNVTVEKNQGTGVLVDGASTRVSIADSTIQDNGERGLWAQRVSGTLDAPAVTIARTNLVRNKIVGVGSVEAHGIIIIGGRVAETVAAPVVTDLATTEQVGDGVGVFSGSTDLKIDGTLVEQNARAAGVVDGTNGIIIIGGKVSAGASGLKFVIQNVKGDVQIPDGDRSSPPTALGISAPKLSVPPVL
jgi:hypothetical protein